MALARSTCPLKVAVNPALEQRKIDRGIRFARSRHFVPVSAAPDRAGPEAIGSTGRRSGPRTPASPNDI
jgi:hypothetical protein